MSFVLNEVTIMEDDRDTYKSISRILNSVGFKVKTVKNAEEAFKNAVNGKSKRYILDINMGNGREQEGLNALEEIKGYNKNIFVSLLSGYPDYYKKMAKKLKADYFQEKTSNPEKDVCLIINEMITYDEKILKRHIASVRTSIDLVIGNPRSTLRDENIIAYKALRLNKSWLFEHNGYYLAFAHGNLVEKNKTRGKLLEQARRNYPNQRLFIIKVTEEEEIIDLVTPLEVLEN